MAAGSTSTRRVLAAAAAAALCAGGAARAQPQAPPIRICDESGCRVQGADYAPPDPAIAEQAVREDVDTYQGEPLAALAADLEAGRPTAAYKLGVVAQYGVGGRPVDEAKAATYYAFAAARGHTWAQYRLASLLSSSRTVRRDPGRALELFFAAAKAGQPQSANNVGLAYLKGRGLPQSNGEAIRWLTVAAEGGVPEAQYNLGLIYLRGDSGAQDLYQGLKWTKTAARAGQLGAKKALGRIYMTGMENVNPDIAEAKRQLEPVALSGDREARGWLDEILRAQAQRREAEMANAKASAAMFGALASFALKEMFAPPPRVIVVG